MTMGLGDESSSKGETILRAFSVVLFAVAMAVSVTIGSGVVVVAFIGYRAQVSEIARLEARVYELELERDRVKREAERYESWYDEATVDLESCRDERSDARNDYFTCDRERFRMRLNGCSGQ